MPRDPRGDPRESPDGRGRYEIHFFDRVVAVSSLEFIDGLRGACREIRRVLLESFEVDERRVAPWLDTALSLRPSRM
jgi:GT2 family glycosyltransferase